MEKDHDIPINVIVLDNIETDTESLLEDYLQILITCRKADEFKALIKMIWDDSRTKTLREILIRDIQNKAQVLEQTKNM